MKKVMILGIIGLAVIFSAFQMLQKENSKREFVADDSTFKNYRDWKVIKTNTGTSPMIRDAHAAEMPDVTRYVHAKDPDVKRDANGDFPRGTVIVKESRKEDGTVEAVTAMVKRGGNFNPEHKGWEWFMLEGPSGKINRDGDMKMRGAALMDGMCNSCHAQVREKDYVFSKD
ncbi:MAG: cytochrome P460 family protein [Bacteroidetes bacterium]|nr:cytochrome P460 family protein [Bacteroidota bacterium]